MSRADDQLKAAMSKVKPRDAFAEQDAADMAKLVTLTKALGVSRDYRKECWIAALNGGLTHGVSMGTSVLEADQALDAFDKRFTPLF